MPKRSNEPRYELADSALNKMKSRARLAKVLQTTEKTLADLTKRDDLYVRRWKNKKKDLWLKEPPSPEEAANYRPIDIPNVNLKSLQKRIAVLLGRILPPDFLFSPVKGRSYVDNAARHRGAKAFWLLDVADYFPSCTANNVAHFFRRELGCSPDVTAILVRLTTYQGCLPHGSPCSPIMAYFSNGPMWRQISRLVEDTGCTLSVYADDITISGQVVPKKLIWSIKKVVHRHGMKLKREKELSLISKPADITGVIVRGDETKIPNRQLKRIAKLRAERRSAKNSKLKTRLDNKIAGHIAQRQQIEGAC